MFRHINSHHTAGKVQCNDDVDPLCAAADLFESLSRPGQSHDQQKHGNGIAEKRDQTFPVETHIPFRGNGFCRIQRRDADRRLFFPPGEDRRKQNGKCQQKKPGIEKCSHFVPSFPCSSVKVVSRTRVSARSAASSNAMTSAGALANFTISAETRNSFRKSR